MEQNKKIDLYDFDKTIVPFDSALKYWGFCMAHCPWTLVLFPFQFAWGMMMLTHIISTETCKKYCFWYIRMIDNPKVVKKFWDKYECKVAEWFKPENRKRPCCIVSASPDFLIEEIAKRLNVEYCITSKHDPKGGLLIGKVCKKAEKVRRFKELLPDAEVVNVYSDNLKSDKYIFALGEKQYLVKKGEITDITATFDRSSVEV